MEPTVIMSIDSYISMKNQITDLVSDINESFVQYQELVHEAEEKDQLIKQFQLRMVQTYIDATVVAEHPLDYLLKVNDTCPTVINGMFKFAANEYELFGITIDLQREYVTKYYNERMELKHE